MLHVNNALRDFFIQISGLLSNVNFSLKQSWRAGLNDACMQIAKSY